MALRRRNDRRGAGRARRPGTAVTIARGQPRTRARLPVVPAARTRGRLRPPPAPHIRPPRTGPPSVRAVPAYPATPLDAAGCPEAFPPIRGHSLAPEPVPRDDGAMPRVRLNPAWGASHADARAIPIVGAVVIGPRACGRAAEAPWPQAAPRPAGLLGTRPGRRANRNRFVGHPPARGTKAAHQETGREGAQAAPRARKACHETPRALPARSVASPARRLHGPSRIPA